MDTQFFQTSPSLDESSSGLERSDNESTLAQGIVESSVKDATAKDSQAGECIRQKSASAVDYQNESQKSEDVAKKETRHRHLIRKERGIVPSYVIFKLTALKPIILSLL